MQIAGVETELLWDTGTVDRTCATGIIIDCDTFEKIRGNLEDPQIVPVYTAHGRSEGRSGKGKVRVVGFGPEIETRIFTFCGGSTEKLVGTCFFRRLKGYKLIWDFDSDEICLEKKQDDGFE
jgi:hypothetical protein